MPRATTMKTTRCGSAFCPGRRRRSAPTTALRLAARRHSLPRLADGAGPRVPRALGGAARRYRHDDPQPRVPGRVRQRPGGGAIAAACVSRERISSSIGGRCRS
jgi:hypothetical protein